MTKSSQVVSVRDGIINSPHEEEPAHGEKKRSRNVDEYAEFRLESALVGARYQSCCGVAKIAC